MTGKIYEFADIRLDTVRFEVSKSGQPVDLEPKAIDVLLFLAQRPGQLVLKEELLDGVWRDTFVTPNALTRVIAQLRKALDDDAQEARIIETVPRKGYRLLPSVVGTEGPAVAVPTPVGSTPAPTESKRSRTAPIALGAAAAIVLVAVAGWTWLHSSRSDERLTVDELVQITAAPGYESDPSLAPDAKRLAYTSDETGANEVFVRPVGDGPAIQLTKDGAQNSQPAWSPDGAYVAYRSLVKRGIWVIGALGGAARQVSPSGSDPAWSRDGTTIAFSTWEGALAESSSIMLVPSAGGPARALTQAGHPTGGHRDPAWSHDGTRVAFWSFDGARGGGLWMVSASGGEPVRLSDQIYPSALAFTPDDRMVCWSGLGPRAGLGAWCVPARAGNSEPPLAIVQGVASIAGLSIAADGTIAYAATQVASDLWAVPLAPSNGSASGRAAPLAQDTWRNSHPTFSPDGKWVAYLNWRPGTPSDLWLMNMKTLASEFLVPGKTAEFYPTWYPDSRHLMMVTGRGAGRQVSRVSIETRQVTALSGLPPAMSNFSLSPDGKDLAYHAAGENGRLASWRVSMAGGEPMRLSRVEDSAGYPTWSHDGRRLALEIEEAGDTHIYVIDRDGNGLRKLTSGKGQNWPHSWAPDNDRIAIAAERDGIWNVMTVSAASGSIVQLTSFTEPNAYVRYPAWSPLNDRIVFERAVTTANLWTGRLRGFAPRQ